MDDLDDPFNLSFPDPRADRSGPSLFIVLISAVTGLAGAVLGLYAAYELAFLIAPVSAGIATLSGIAGIVVMATILTMLAGTRSTLVNIAFSCGLLILVLLFFGLCLLAGAIGATLLLT